MSLEQVSSANKKMLYIDSPTVAAILARRSKAIYLDPFLSRACTISQAAKELGVSSSQLSYWVKKYQNLGLIKMIRKEKRGRNVVKIYRSTADKIIIPLELIPQRSDEEILEANMGPWWEAFKRSLVESGRKTISDWHISIYRLDNKVGTFIEPKEGNMELAKLLNYWLQLRLSEGTATAFRREIKELMTKYQGLEDDSGKMFIVHLAVVEKS